MVYATNNCVKELWQFAGDCLGAGVFLPYFDGGRIARDELCALEACNGWTFWHYEIDGELKPIDDLRTIIRADMAKLN